MDKAECHIVMVNEVGVYPEEEGRNEHNVSRKIGKRV